MKYLSAKQTAVKWGISPRRIQILCKEERIPGAFIVGNSWAIPETAEKPKDARVRNGKYIKKKDRAYHKKNQILFDKRENITASSSRKSELKGSG